MTVVRQDHLGHRAAIAVRVPGQDRDGLAERQAGGGLLSNYPRTGGTPFAGRSL